MNKVIAWIFIIIGIIMLLPLIKVDVLGTAGNWLMMLGFLIIGILKLVSK